MPHKIIAGPFGIILDFTVMGGSFVLLTAQALGTHLDAGAVIAAIAGLLIAIGRLILYIAQAYKMWREAQLLGKDFQLSDWEDKL